MIEDGIDDGFEWPIDALEGDEHARFLRRRPTDKGDFASHDAFASIGLRSIGQGEFESDLRADGARRARIDEESALGKQWLHARDELFLRSVS